MRHVIFLVMISIGISILPSSKSLAQNGAWVDAALTKGPEVRDKAIKWGKIIVACIENGSYYRWWCCKYSSGTIVYNNFRCYRTGLDVYNHFTGKTVGDCDAFFYNSQGKEVHLCYGGFDKALNAVDRFGKIEEVYPY